MSTQVTIRPKSASPAPTTSPTYPVPMTVMCMQCLLGIIQTLACGLLVTPWRRGTHRASFGGNVKRSGLSGRSGRCTGVEAASLDSVVGSIPVDEAADSFLDGGLWFKSDVTHQVAHVGIGLGD